MSSQSAVESTKLNNNEISVNVTNVVAHDDDDVCILINNINDSTTNHCNNKNTVVVNLDVDTASTANGTTSSGPDDKKQLLACYDALKELCKSNIEFYENDETSKGQRLHGAFVGLIDHIDIAKPLILEINEFAHEFDFDEKTPGNGYRSFVYVTECCINHGIKICSYITENRNSLLFRKGIYMKEIEACHHLLASLCTCLKHLLKIRSWCDSGELISSDPHTPEELFNSGDPINQYPFYGRCLGFQFCESMRPILKFIQICMAGFSEAYYSSGGKIAKATSSMWTGGKYFMDPELRSRRIVNISWNAKIEFCKSFWDLAESEMMQKLPKFGSQAKINKLITLNPDPMRIEKVTTNEFIDVPIPMSHRGAAQLNVRLISSTRRDGMYGAQANCRRKTHSVTNGLIFHCHGGGFVAQSSKSHENYLIEWTTKLNIPIISVDYSLAPESPFPRALEEVFFAYCWAINNCDLLGTTAERIILVGDSAGANLCFSLALRTIEMGVRKPDGIFAAYCPVLLTRNPSPGRLLCMMDPLLPYGFMMRCMKAYAGITIDPDENCTSKMNSPMSKSSLPTVLETKEEEVAGEFIKVSQQQVNKVESGSEKSDSFEENSVWEHIQASDSDLQHLQAHKSPISDATSDTLAGASFRSQNGATNDILTPDEAIGISLDEGVLDLDRSASPTNIPKDENAIDSSGSDGDEAAASKSAENFDLESYLEEKDQTSSEYVSDFIGRYVLDTKVESDGTRHPILRSVSRTQSEENIVFDIGREAITTQNIQERITKVATNLATAVTTTINTMSSVNSVEENELTTSSVVSSIDKPVELTLSREFDFEMPKTCYMSPYLAEDVVLSQLPTIKIFTVYTDPCLDDCVMFAKKLKKLGVPIGLDILKGLPHGFLNFSTISKEANNASQLCVQRLAELLNLKLIQKK